MKSNRILKMLPKLQVLDEDTLKKLDTTIDACVVVQTLKNITLDKKIENMKNRPVL